MDEMKKSVNTRIRQLFLTYILSQCIIFAFIFESQQTTDYNEIYAINILFLMNLR
jgi:hypothetical protein